MNSLLESVENGTYIIIYAASLYILYTLGHTSGVSTFSLRMQNMSFTNPTWPPPSTERKFVFVVSVESILFHFSIIHLLQLHSVIGTFEGVLSWFIPVRWEHGCFVHPVNFSHCFSYYHRVDIPHVSSHNVVSFRECWTRLSSWRFPLPTRKGPFIFNTRATENTWQRHHVRMPSQILLNVRKSRQHDYVQEIMV